MEKHKAVILGANYYIGLSAIRCLGSQGIPVTAVDYSQTDTYGFASKYCKEKLIAPHYKDHPLETISFLEEYGKKQELKPVLLPSADAYVELMEPYYQRLRQYYLLPDTPPGLNTDLLNKASLRELAQKHGVLTPETILPGEEGFYDRVEAEIGYPCLVKPFMSHSFVSKFRAKMFTVKNREELQKALGRVEEAKIPVFVQRIISGFDDHMYTFNAYLDQRGKVTHWMTCQKQRQYPINFGASVYTKQRYVPELFKIGAPFLEDVGFRGLAEIEFKKDARSGKFYLIEVNVRLSNLSSLFAKVGLNMPYIMYRDLTGNPLPPKKIVNDLEVYFWYAFEDLLAIRHYLKAGQLTLGQVLESHFKPKAYAVWDSKDPLPALSFLKRKGKRLVNALKR